MSEEARYVSWRSRRLAAYLRLVADRLERAEMMTSGWIIAPKEGRYGPDRSSVTTMPTGVQIVTMRLVDASQERAWQAATKGAGWIDMGDKPAM